jgi:hypothetical protein
LKTAATLRRPINLSDHRDRRRLAARLESFPAIEGLERNPRSPAGPLSEGTLKVMLLAQELEQRHRSKDAS